MGIQMIVERAAADPDFLGRLAQDPAGTVQAEGYRVSAREVRALLALPDAGDRAVVEVLQARLSHSSDTNTNGGRIDNCGTIG